MHLRLRRIRGHPMARPRAHRPIAGAPRHHLKRRQPPWPLLGLLLGSLHGLLGHPRIGRARHGCGRRTKMRSGWSPPLKSARSHDMMPSPTIGAMPRGCSLLCLGQPRRIPRIPPSSGVTRLWRAGNISNTLFLAFSTLFLFLKLYSSRRLRADGAARPTLIHNYLASR